MYTPPTKLSRFTEKRERESNKNLLGSLFYQEPSRECVFWSLASSVSASFRPFLHHHIVAGVDLKPTTSSLLFLFLGFFGADSLKPSPLSSLSRLHRWCVRSWVTGAGRFSSQVLSSLVHPWGSSLSSLLRAPCFCCFFFLLHRLCRSGLKKHKASELGWGCCCELVLVLWSQASFLCCAWWQCCLSSPLFSHKPQHLCFFFPLSVCGVDKVRDLHVSFFLSLHECD